MPTETLIETLERAVPLNQIAMPGNPSPVARWRWRTNGIKCGGGRVVKLKTWRLAGAVVTTPEAVEEFYRELNAPESEAGE